MTSILFLVSLLYQFPVFKGFTSETTSTYMEKDSLRYEKESHFRNVKQLTFGGDNAEAYWSFNGQMLTFQSNFKNWGVECDQIFLINPEKANASQYTPKLLSTGKGRTTCSYFLPGDKLILYASTHEKNDKCPAEPERKQGSPYLWPIYDSYDIYTATLKGKLKKKLTNNLGYDAEATVSPKGDRIVFTSTRSGDLELWTMKIDGSDVKQITHDLGYDGGAFFSPDGSKIVFRASRPKSKEEIASYKKYLSEGLVAPTQMEIFICNSDGSNLKQITKLGKANWAPFFHPSGKKIIFSSNHESKKGFQFNLYMINIDGTGLEKVTYDTVFDSFPMFSPDGKKIVFSSNRNNKGTKDTNLFIADWVD